MSFIKLVAALLLLFLIGCTHSSISTQINVDIAPQAQFSLTLPSKALWNTELSQQMEIRYGDNVHQLILLTAFNAESIGIVALTPAGIPLFELSFNENKQINVVKHLPIDGLSPEYVLADLQLVYWPLQQLNNQLSEGTSLVENVEGQRVVMQNSQPIIRIEKNGNIISYQHLVRNYQFTVTNLE